MAESGLWVLVAEWGEQIHRPGGREDSSLLVGLCDRAQHPCWDGPGGPDLREGMGRPEELSPACRGDLDVQADVSWYPLVTGEQGDGAA